MTHRPLSASGFQVTFLVFAVVFMAAPATKFLGPLLDPDGDMTRSLSRAFIFVPALVILCLIPQVRAFCRRQLAIPISSNARTETIAAAAAHVGLPFAMFGALILWHWTLNGEMGLARWVGQHDTAAAAYARALSVDGVAMLVMGAIIGPVVEELVFRGILFRTWEAEWGWFKAMIATSIVFAAYHPVPFAAFVGSIILVVLYRRTGSLRACILAHAVFNAVQWHPLLGQFIFRTAGKETGEIELWPFHLAALAALTAALPVYVWMARDHEVEEEAPEEMCVAGS